MSAFSYQLELVWTGQQGHTAGAYREYSRDLEIRIAGKPLLLGSADTPFRGDPARHNPEDLLLASLASCHMLSYLYLATRAGLSLLGYRDQARGRLQLQGVAGRFSEVVLQPEVWLANAADMMRAESLHQEAHQACFIANSVNFPVRIEPRSRIDSF